MKERELKGEVSVSVGCTKFAICTSKVVNVSVVFSIKGDISGRWSSRCTLKHLLSVSLRASIHCLTTRKRHCKHIPECTLHLPSGGVSWQPDVHLVLGGGQRLLQEVKL